MTTMTNNFIRKIRAEKQIMLIELAKSTGLLVEDIFNFEKGIGDLVQEDLSKIATALGVSINYILTGESEEIDFKNS